MSLLALRPQQQPLHQHWALLPSSVTSWSACGQAKDSVLVWTEASSPRHFHS